MPNKGFTDAVPALVSGPPSPEQLSTKMLKNQFGGAWAWLRGLWP